MYIREIGINTDIFAENNAIWGCVFLIKVITIFDIHSN